MKLSKHSKPVMQIKLFVTVEVIFCYILRFFFFFQNAWHLQWILICSRQRDTRKDPINFNYVSDLIVSLMNVNLKNIFIFRILNHNYKYIHYAHTTFEGDITYLTAQLKSMYICDFIIVGFISHQWIPYLFSMLSFQDRLHYNLAFFN